MSDTINVSNISFDKGKIKGCSVSISGKIFTVKWDSGQYNVEAGGTAGAPPATGDAANTPPASDGTSAPPAASAPPATSDAPAASAPPAAGSGDNEYTTQTELITKLDRYDYKSSV